jgi:two-component system, NtrC family, sensor kinase
MMAAARAPSFGKSMFCRVARSMTLALVTLMVASTAETASTWSTNTGQIFMLPDELDEHYDLSSSFDWLEDKRAPTGAAGVTAHDPRFQRAPGGRSCLGFHTAPVWFRLQLAHMARSSSTFVLELGFTPTIAELFKQEGEGLVLLARSGATMPFTERPVQSTEVALPLRLDPMSTSTLLLRIEANDAIWTTADLWSEPAFARMSARRSLGQGLYYGMLLAMIVYNAFIYASTRERTYLLYVWFQGAMLVLQASLDKVAFQSFWPMAPVWAERSEQVLMSLTILAAMRFSVAFLDLPRHLPALAKVFGHLAVVAALFSVASLFTVGPGLATLLGVFCLGCVATIAAAGAVASLRGLPNGSFFLLGWAPLLIGAGLGILAALGHFSNSMGYAASKLGSTAEAMILALALGNRINHMRRERELSSAALLEERTAQSMMLEEGVVQRTRELSQALEHLKQTQDKLVRQERVTSLAGMVAGMAHEVGNPLNFAQGGADVVHEGVETLSQSWGRLRTRFHAGDGQSEEQDTDVKRMGELLQDAKRGVALVRVGIQRISTIMTNLRGYMQLRAVESTPTDLVAEIESALVLAESALLRHGVTVVRDLSPLPLFECRPGELNQVFSNIILNACAAMSHGGVIEISARTDAAGSIVITFADNGPGIPLGHRESIFEPFFSAHVAGGAGTGLGLYLAREIVARHGGQLALEDSAVGARFVVRLAVPS